MSEGSHALVVATARYDDPKLQQLRAPAADAEELANVLGDPEKGDFDVEVVVDETHAHLTRAIARFFRDRSPQDLLLLHFSCHGVKDEDGELYLAATDTDLNLLSATGISATWLNERISRTRSRRTVVLLDCCFSGSFPAGLRAAATTLTRRSSSRAVAARSSRPPTRWSTPMRASELKGAGRPSVFTEAVVEGLRTGEADLDQDQLVSIDDLYRYVYDRVRERTPSQTPSIKSDLEGPLYLARSTYRRPVEPAQLDPELLARTEDRYAGIREGAVQELAALSSPMAVGRAGGPPCAVADHLRRQPAGIGPGAGCARGRRGRRAGGRQAVERPPAEGDEAAARRPRRRRVPRRRAAPSRARPRPVSSRRPRAADPGA